MFNTTRNWKIRDDDTIYEMMRMYNNVSSGFDALHSEMTKNYDFTVAELQWDKEVKEKLKSERRPANSYNLIRTILNVIIAIELQNRRQVVVKPKGEGDNELAQVMTEVLLHFLRNTKFDYHRTKVFLDSIVAKFGVYYVGWSYEKNPMGELIVEAIDPREIIFEPNYGDPLWQKSSFLFRKHSLSIEEILNQYALNDVELQDEIIKEASIFFEQDEDKKRKWINKKLKALFSAVYETAIGFDTGDKLFKNYLQWWDPATGKFDLLELHEIRTERRLLIYDEERGKNYDITELTKEDDGIRFNNEKIQQVKEMYQLKGEPRVDLENKRYLTTVIPAFNIKVNEQPYPFKSNYYVYIPQYCYDYHADPTKAQSIIDDLRDPQSHFNKAQSLKLELLGRYVNKGWILDENAIDGLEEDWTSERIAPYRRVRAGYINAIRPEEGQTISPDLVRDPIETQSLMKVISNADDEIRGQANPQIKSGRHFIAKEQQQTRSFSYIFNNVNNSAKAVCELAVNFIQHFVTTQRIFRITTNENTENVNEIIVNQSQYMIEEGKIIEKVKNDLTIGEYDIEISDTPYSANAKEIEYAKLIDLYEAVVNINPRKAELLLEDIIEMGAFPNGQKILEKWRRLEEPNPNQMQLAQIMQQLQMIIAKLGIEEKQEDIKKKKLENLEKAQRIKNTAKYNLLGKLSNTNNNQQIPIDELIRN